MEIIEDKEKIRQLMVIPGLVDSLLKICITNLNIKFINFLVEIYKEKKDYKKIKMIKEYIKQIYSLGKNENLVSDILQKFNSIFHCELNVIIYDSEVELFFNIVKSVQLLHIIFKFFYSIFTNNKVNIFVSLFTKFFQNLKRCF